MDINVTDLKPGQRAYVGFPHPDLKTVKAVSVKHGWATVAFEDGTTWTPRATRMVAVKDAPTVEAVVAAMKANIVVDMEEGIVPATVTSYSQLHDYVDANMYGYEVWEDTLDGDALIALLNAAQTEVDAWLKAGLK